VLCRSRAGRTLMYGVLTSHPARISPDHALGDFRAFEYARPAMRLLLEAATPFDQYVAPEIPVTIAWAARDLVLPLWQAGVAKALLPHAQHVTMRGVGHVPMFDNPELVAQVLLRGSAQQVAVTGLADAVAATDLPDSRAAASASA
jgi:pimeloyl-ACP methyl ester carboxylesterase